ncbi:MAG: acylphosphatase [Paludisphaera borealis]|uniref:acylphosphatase n=1 Tax=Paludisphaera borealis TaxID=1387353 RepID=UPI00284399B6|nr:acylphosphatase [Paludisphaera borealis]MDR3619374.1 acylphosphatase [Paludisphaera borealis]
MPLERRRIFFSGRVQGVGFRATTIWLARGFDVAGYVRNLPDGRVEAAAEGDSAELDRFVASIQSELGGFIRELDSSTELIDGPTFTGFVVRR